MERDRTGTSWAGAAFALVGLYLIGSILLFPMASGVRPSMPALMNDLVVGALVLVFGYRAMYGRSVAPFWWEVGLGAWLFAAPLVLRLQDFNEGWHSMTAGLILMIIGSCAGVSRLAARPRGERTRGV